MPIIKSQTAFSFTSSKPFHEILPVLKNRAISLLGHRKVYLGLCQKCVLVWYCEMGIISWICNRPFPNLSKTLMIYFVKIVERFSQNPLNFTFTKYGLIYMQNTVFSNICRSLRDS